MPIKVAINGFGRIGRNIMRTALDDKNIQFVAVKDVTDGKTLAHLLKYDSVPGNLPHTVTHTDDTIAVEGKSFKVFKTKDPAEIDWASVGADIVVESTGLFTKGVDAKKHLRAPVKKVIISAPADGPDATFVLGVNDRTYNPATHHVISNASCTTNCLPPPATALPHTSATKTLLPYRTGEPASTDSRGNSKSSIVDSESTKVVGAACVKVLAWYDNEWGYSCRCRDLIKLLASKF